MFNLDESFLDEIGLGGLSAEEKKPFLQHVYDELEYRVGDRLSEGMSEDQRDEFEHIIDRRDDIIRKWLEDHAPGYANDPIFGKLQQAMNLPVDDIALLSEYTATKWLEFNRPDYREVVSSTLAELKAEITANKDAILGKS